MAIKAICNKCGDCCREFEVFLANTPENFQKRSLIEKFVVDSLDIIFERIDGISMKVYGPCIYLDEKTNKCRIYKNRPERCKQFYCRRAKERWRREKGK